MVESVATLQKAGAEVVIGQPGGGNGYSFDNTLLRVSGDAFLADPEALQTEAFGNESLLVVVRDANQAVEVARHFEGNLTGCIYSDSEGADESVYVRVAVVLRKKVGRLLNDKMPTGVAVVPSMNHGGPIPRPVIPDSQPWACPLPSFASPCGESYDNARTPFANRTTDQNRVVYGVRSMVRGREGTCRYSIEMQGAPWLI